MKHLLAILFSLSLGGFVLAQQSDPFAPAQPLADGWEQMDQRLIFLMVRLVDVEANLDAVDAAIAKSGGRAASARSTAIQAERTNDRMDQRAGGPVRWDKFYGRTAEKFFYHPTENHTYHTQTILGQQSPSNDNQGASGVPSRQGVPVHQRPPQFDYMYRANENAKERATAEVAKIGNKVDALAARRAELELDQSKLWCEVAFRVVSRNDLDKKPLYRFMPKGSGQESLTAAASFVVVALSIVKSGESDQGSAFRQIKPMVTKARSDLGDKWLQLGVKYQDPSSNEWKFASLARHLEDVSSNLSDSYAVSIDSARNSDADRRDMYRGLLQKSLVQYAEAVLALNEMASEMAKAIDFAPDLEKLIAMPKLDFRFADTATYTPSNATGALPLAMQEQTNPTDTRIVSNSVPNIASWKQIVGQYQGSGDDKLELSVNQQGQPQLRRGAGDVSKGWKYIDGTWLFDLGDIDLFSVISEQGESIRLNVYWRANQSGFANAILPTKAADRSFLYTKSPLRAPNHAVPSKNLLLLKKETGEVAGEGWALSETGLTFFPSSKYRKVNIAPVVGEYKLILIIHKVGEAPKANFADFNIKLPIGGNRRVPICIHQLANGSAEIGAYPKTKNVDLGRLRTKLRVPFNNGVSHELAFVVRNGAISILQNNVTCLELTNLSDVVVDNGNELVLEASPEMVATVSSCLLYSSAD